MNIYGPNKDEPQFHETIYDKIKCSDPISIIAGDFNIVLNPYIECSNYVNTNQHPKARAVVSTCII